MYATFEFYTNEYLGTKLTSENFNRYAVRASDFLDRCTRRRLEDGLPTIEADAKKVMKGCCAIADALLDIDTAIAQRGTATTGAIKSMSSGGESISYGDSALEEAVAGGEDAKARYLFEIAKTYLTLVEGRDGEYLLYWGLS